MTEQAHAKGGPTCITALPRLRECPPKPSSTFPIFSSTENRRRVFPEGPATLMPKGPLLLLLRKGMVDLEQRRNRFRVSSSPAMSGISVLIGMTSIERLPRR
jgi:hypothetical protein